MLIFFFLFNNYFKKKKDNKSMKLPNTFMQLYNKKEIKKVVKDLGKLITTEYNDEDTTLVVIGLAEGGLMFTMDLIRKIDLPIEYHTCVVKSYGNSHKNNNPQMIYFPDIKFDKHKKYLIVDDICDTGNSIKFVYDYLAMKVNKEDIKTCVLLKNKTKQSVIKCDFIGLTTEGEWLVGYGFDEQQIYRNIPNLMYINF